MRDFDSEAYELAWKAGFDSGYYAAHEDGSAYDAGFDAGYDAAKGVLRP